MKLLSEFDKTKGTKVSCIYKVTNLINGKIYIGQTTNFRKRLSDYKNIHKKDDLTQPIAIDVRKYGTNNFTIEIVKLCNPEELSKYEEKYIKKFKTEDPRYGYNIFSNINSSQNDIESRRRKSLSHVGLKESSNTKRKKSNTILAIKNNSILVCDSGKLFADYIGSTKDVIKNALRQPFTYQGYNLYYNDYNKRQEIRDKMVKKRSIRNTEYMNILNILDFVEFEGVETIYQYFDSVFILEYTDDNYRVIPFTTTEVDYDELFYSYINSLEE